MSTITLCKTPRVLIGFLAVSALIFALLLYKPALADGPAVGAAAPVFTGTTSDGETISLEDLRGQKVILEWTNHLCPFVVKHYTTDNMQALQRRAQEEGILWLSIISSAPGKQGYLEADEVAGVNEARNAVPAHVILDPSGDIGRLYKARTTPQMFIIDEEGTLLYMGGIDDKPTSRHADVATAKNYVTAALDSLAVGEPIADTNTRPYGCAVHY